MRRIVFLFGLLGTSLPGALQAQTEPVGFYKISVAPGTRATGLPLNTGQVASGTIAAKSGAILTSLEASENYGEKLKTSVSYYLEITDGPANTYLGERFDLDTKKTIAAGSNQITIKPLSVNNTSSSLPDLSGYSFVIRPHLTLATAFDKTALRSGATVTNADQVQFYNTSTKSYTVYYLFRSADGKTTQWRKKGTTASADATVIPPGTGFFLKRSGSSNASLIFSGEVRTSEFFPQKLKAGLNFVSEGYPITSTPNTRGCTVANGFTGSTDSDEADQLKVWTGSAYTKYFLYKSGTTKQWRKVGETDNFSNSSLFRSNGAVFILKRTADASYAAPKPF